MINNEIGKKELPAMVSFDFNELEKKGKEEGRGGVYDRGYYREIGLLF